MYFYQVAVASAAYHGQGYLTYSHSKKIPVGAIVEVQLRNTRVNGVVLGSDSKPKFKIKEIDNISEIILPQYSLSLLKWIKSYYPAPLGTITSLFVNKNIHYANNLPPEITTLMPVQLQKLPALNTEQKSIIKAIEESPSKAFLLHGETASGKTHIYLELTKDCLSHGKSVLVLVPEISLTSQLVKVFQQYFGDQVVLTHSDLTPKQRSLAWNKIYQARTPQIIIGPRSALFAPINNKLGLIVLDEAHEPAYKQETSPHYQSSRVAAALSSIHGAKLMLGSATPLVSDYYSFELRNLPILKLKSVVFDTGSRKTELIDLKDSSLFTMHPFLSNPLLEAIQNALSKGEQALIFLNRRGSARRIFCKNCLWSADCPRCSLPLIYHGDKHLLRCHSCGLVQKVISKCQKCDSDEIIFKSIGTKALEASLKKLFPQSKIQRFDTDSSKSESISVLYNTIHSGEVDILVGTQMLAKGLDLPKLSVVGVVFADSSLTFPDYTADERTYQLINQVLGRVGRGHRKGKVFIQTYNSSSQILKDAVTGNWDDFYSRQISQRLKYGFPPIYYFLKIQIRRASSKNAEEAIVDLISKLPRMSEKIIISDPVPAFTEKRSGKYYWQTTIKSKNRELLTALIKELPPNTFYDLDPNNLL